MVYAYHLKAIWPEIDHFWPVENPRSVERGYTLKQRLFTFLLGFNLIYEGVRVQILNCEKIPDLKSAIGMIADEELRMNVNSGMKNGSESQTTPELAFVARKSDGRFNPKNNAQSSQLSSNIKSGGQSSDHDPRDDMFCKHCKMKQHTKDTFWKLAYKNHQQQQNPKKAFVAKSTGKAEQT